MCGCLEGVGEPYSPGMASLLLHYESLLGLPSPWEVSEVRVRHEIEEIEVVVEWQGGPPACLECGVRRRRLPSSAGGGMADRPLLGRRRRWRHLDFCDHKLFVVCEVPRAHCAEHGVATIRVPWAEPKSRYTADFETHAIDWLLEASTAAVARQLRLSWNALDGIRRRAVERGLARRSVEEIRDLAVDETAFRRRHRYVTVVSDPGSARVLHVARGRKQVALEEFF